MIKNIFKLNYMLLAALFAVAVSSCKDDSSGINSGEPYILYVRITNPASADSLLVAANQGQMIAIVGGNLQNTKQLWFNDQQATLTPTYISNNAIIVSVPTLIPSVVNNKMKLIFANGDSLLYDFKVTISKPIIDGANKLKPNGMDCEYVPDGEIAVIHGNYLYFPLSVTFTGGQTVSSEDGDITVNDKDLYVPYTILTVKVPEGAQPGPITITNNFGTTVSNFWFRDDRNIFQGYDANDGWWNGTWVSDPGAGDPPLINGPYYRITNSSIGGGSWVEVFNWWENHNIPDDAILNPSHYYYKFEVNTLKPYTSAGCVKIWVGDPANGTDKGYYSWTTPLDTKGAWQTVTIPFDDIMAKNAPCGVLSAYFFGFVFNGGSGVLDCDMCFDNFRIVPNGN